MGLCMSDNDNENINSNILSNISFVVETLEVNALVLKYKYSDSEEISKMILVSY